MTNMQTFHKLAMVFSTPSAIFRIPTRDRGDVFMRIGRTGYENDRRAVVEVDADRFLDLWRRDPYEAHADVSRGNPTTWVRDRKFSYAEEGFAGGESNPVPLADVDCTTHIKQRPLYRSRLLVLRKLVGYEREDIPHVSFSDGITRTIWLLTHGARVFPVMCSVSEAPLLKQLAGLPGGSFCTVDQLVPAAAVPLRSCAAAVFEYANREYFTRLLDTFEAAADEQGYRFVTGSEPAPFPDYVREALGDAVVATRLRLVSPLLSELNMVRARQHAREDGTGDAWVTLFVKALAAQGIVAELRQDHLPPPLQDNVTGQGAADA
ncbi:plasmid fertility inhibition factor family protein [Paraburkholderia ginsengisoli]|uniref:Uncharacterized protein n=1 Tax=Paraburkholderia ginsengisoli TaxID=311231 RepID=A0A7T4N9T0_9BURK|nr:hypothetical protein [Paraburkholderia ginsengisoli]QQC67846.1 hypothetical protein I6I06_28930 [Paraburkholderia ginsengisoli]